jgi:hypothetical protein
MQTGKKSLRTYGQASRGIPSVQETPDDEKITEQSPDLSAEQQNNLTAIENYSRHFGLEKEGLAFAHAQAGLPPPTEEQKKVAEQGLPVRPEQPDKKTFSLHNGGFYLGEKSQ